MTDPLGPVGPPEPLPPTTVVASTADLTPDGVLGWAKGLAAIVSGILVVLVPLFPLQYVVWLQAAIALCGAIAVIALPNSVKPVIITAS